MTKPFCLRELVARIKAALGRLKTGASLSVEGTVLTFKHIRIDAGAWIVQVDENPIELIAIEFDLLKALAENRGRVLSREPLLEKVWGVSTSTKCASWMCIWGISIRNWDARI
jgi:two-component system alkaline phosphatase synthesis response regulator PhoP